MMQYFKLRDIETTEHFAYSPNMETCIDCDDVDDHSHLMQYTELKDKNGEYLDWYDGDILKCIHFKAVNTTHYLFHVIIWSNVYGAWLAIAKEYYLKDHSLKLNGNLQLCIYKKVSANAEVVGNIYENPELI